MPLPLHSLHHAPVSSNVLPLTPSASNEYYPPQEQRFLFRRDRLCLSEKEARLVRAPLT